MLRFGDDAQLTDDLKGRISLLPDDYLQGIITLVNELVRSSHLISYPDRTGVLTSRWLDEKVEVGRQ